jgi:ABC-type sugar transport system permease subunit
MEYPVQHSVMRRFYYCHISSGTTFLWVLPFALVTLAHLAFLSPVFSYNPLVSFGLFGEGGGTIALLRTLAFASVSSISEVIVGFGLAVLTQRVARLQVLRLVPFLMLPALIGNVAFSFIVHESLPLIQFLRDRHLLSACRGPGLFPSRVQVYSSLFSVLNYKTRPAYLSISWFSHSRSSFLGRAVLPG